MKDVKQKHQQKLIDQKIQEIEEEEEKEYISSMMSEKKYSWRNNFKSDPEVKEEIFIDDNQSNWKFDWRNQLLSDKKRYFGDETIDESMSSKDFEYLYGISSYNFPIISAIQTQSTQAQDIVQASADVTNYAFGQNFPGSYVNSIGDYSVNSTTKVDAVAFLDTTYGNSSGGGGTFSLNTGNDPFPPEGSGSIPGSVTSRGSLESALGISLPAGVPNGNLGGTPIEGSAVKRVFSGAKVGNRINFNWAFSSSEDALGPASVDDYAFVAIQGRTTKFVSVLTKGLVSTGQFLYTVQANDIDANGNVTVSVGVMDVYDQYIKTNLTLTNFGSLWQTGSVGDTTDAADLGMSVDAADPNKKKRDDEVAQVSDDQERRELKMLLKFYKQGGGGSGPDIDKQIRNLEIKLYGMPISASYEPEGNIISEKKIQKSLKSVKQVLYPGQPSPNGYPEQEPPKLASNGYHPDFGKRGNMYNTLDKISADSMPLTGDSEIDKKVKAARKKPK